MIVVLVRLMCRQSLAFETEIILTQAAFLSVDATTAVVSLDRAIRYCKPSQALLCCREARSFLDNCILKVVVVLLYAIDIIGGASSLERDRIKSCIRSTLGLVLDDLSKACGTGEVCKTLHHSF